MLKLIVGLGLVACIFACSDRSGESNCKSWRDNHDFCKRSDADYYCSKTCGKCTPGGGGGNGQCGISKVTQGRVVNGVNSVPGAWPWIASLQLRNGHYCGATLLNTKWVLTASHCVDQAKNLVDWTIKLGAHDHRKYEPSAQRIKIKRIIMHPNYGQSLNADVAMIELASPAKLNDRVSVPCLPKKGVYPAAGKNCYIAGWGSIQHPGGVYHTLQQAKLPVVQSPHKGCHNRQEVVCVGLGFGKQADGKQHPNACRGDSGGPLVCQQSDGRWQLEGVASYVYTYCKYYTAYAPVNKYLDWINSYASQM